MMRSRARISPSLLVDREQAAYVPKAAAVCAEVVFDVCSMFVRHQPRAPVNVGRRPVCEACDVQGRRQVEISRRTRSELRVLFPRVS